jgi:peptide deformylase
MTAIVLAPNQILRSPATAVNLPSSKLSSIIDTMRQTLISQTNPQGVGLAANQMGLPYKIFLARWTTKKDEPVHVFINPEILGHSDELQGDGKKDPLEGCLSLPKYYGHVKRYKWVKLKYQILTTNYQLQTTDSIFDGFPAVVIQHEMDHLNGKIFVERILEQKGILYRITGKKNQDGKEIWERVEI